MAYSPNNEFSVSLESNVQSNKNLLLLDRNLAGFISFILQIWI